MTTPEQLNAWRDEAARLGRDAGIAAASWCYDGNSDREERARVLAMLRDGDPAAWDYLPPFPNLSGEWADEATPALVVGAATDMAPSSVPDDVWDELCNAWEAAASEAFQLECERLLVLFCEEPAA